MTRSLLLCLACLPAWSLAQSLPDNFSQEIFERRFNAADKDRDGRLSRAEAYAEFPRAPKFFDEIDADRNQHVTLIEFRQAMERRGAAALDAASRGGSAKYVKPEYLQAAAPAAGAAGPRDMSSSIAQRRSHDFSEFLGGEQDHEAYPDDSGGVDNRSNLVRRAY